jgi:uncharacterized Zn finger protein
MPDNEFGYTRWGMDWVRLAEPLRITRPEPLLPRARSVARSGGVRTEIEGPAIRASIHRGNQASVTHVEATPLSRAEITAISALIPGGTVELGDAEHTAIANAGISLAPPLCVTDCSCSARTPRCLHFLATCYTVARMIDENPWLALDLRGFRSTSEDSTPAPPPRWTPIDMLDPVTYFGEVARPTG